MEALDDFHRFCNGLIKLKINFELDINNLDQLNNNHTLLRVGPEHPSIVYADKKYDAATLGLCEWMQNQTTRLYLVPERLTNPISFRTTAIHELGHFVGLGHSPKPSIMYKYNYDKVLYPTYKDAIELSKLSGYSPEKFRYFKL